MICAIILFLIAIVFCIAIVAIELYFRKFIPIPDPYGKNKNKRIVSIHEPNTRALFVNQDQLRGLAESSNFCTNNLGFRGENIVIPKPDNEFRIFLVGASNIECFFLDDKEALNARLQQKLSAITGLGINVKVYAAGKSGNSANNQISVLGHTIVFLQPDLIIYNTLANEFFRFQPQNNIGYLDVDASQYSLSMLAKMLICEFQIGRRIYQYLNSKKDQTWRVISPVRSRAGRCRSRKQCDKHPLFLETELKIKLRTIAGMLKANNINIIFMSQPDAWHTEDPELLSNLWLTLLYDGKKYSKAVMSETMRRANEILAQIAEEQQILFCDLVKSLEPTSEYFYDDTHYTGKGADKLAEDMAKFINEQQMLKK